VGDRDHLRSHRHRVRRASAIADAASDTPFTDAYRDQFDGIVGCRADQSRQQFPGAAGQPVEQWLQPPAANQSRRWRWLREYGSAALPDLVRRLRELYEDRRGRRFRRRYQEDLGRRGRDWRAGGAGINIGLSVDQSRSAIDIPLALQSATIDLTQIGFTASVDSGPWTWASAVVHGFGNINSRRDTGLGIASAGYNAKLDGVLSEISYYWTRDQNRIVPKAAFEYVQARTGSLQEIGGLDPVTATGATVQRGRLLIGAELGHYWIFDGKIFDLSGYGKFVDNLVQNFSDITVSQGVQSITFQGIGESRYGADAGASASLSLTNAARLYVNYDAKLRAAMQSHQGTVGLELRW
jgi:hypothetical protein